MPTPRGIANNHADDRPWPGFTRESHESSAGGASQARRRPRAGGYPLAEIDLPAGG
jgi:hypothetical protein